MLYGDMSRRVMQTLAAFTPELEIYSIDEAFLNLAGFEHGGLIPTATSHDAFAQVLLAMEAMQPIGSGYRARRGGRLPRQRPKPRQRTLLSNAGLILT